MPLKSLLLALPARTLPRVTVALALGALTAAAVTVPAAAATPGGPAAVVTRSMPAAPSVVTGHGELTALPTTTRLSWAPPALSSPTTVHVSASNRDLRLDPAKDYIVKMPSTALSVLGGLQISGGRNVVLIGGRISIPSGATASGNANRGLYLKGQRGTIHIEGLLITGAGLGEGINLDQRYGAVVQLQNLRIETVRGSQAGHHADLLQTWAGPRKLRVDGLTGYTQYQGMFLLPQSNGTQPQPEIMDIRRTDIRGTSSSGVMIWRDKLTWPLRATDVWVLPRTTIGNYLYPTGTGTGTSAWSSIRKGTPPTGEFVPAGTAGTGYVSPGYAGSSTTVSAPAMTAPVIGAVTGARAAGGKHYTRASSVEVSWSGAGASARSYEVLRSGTRVATVAAGTTRAVVPLVTGSSTVTVRAVGVAPSVTSAPVTVVRDTTAPVFTSSPGVQVRSGTVSSAGVVPVTVRWSASDAVRMRDVALTTPTSGRYAVPATSASVSATPGSKTWTLVARDEAGNTATRSSSRTMAIVGESSATRSGTWSTITSSQHIGGTARRATAAGASMSHTFTGRSVAWTALRGPGSGRAVVYVDGQRIQTVDLGSSTTSARRVVFTRGWSSSGTHTIKIVVEGTSGRPGVTSDGFITVS